jgi:hypothetical protein
MTELPIIERVDAVSIAEGERSKGGYAFVMA